MIPTNSAVVLQQLQMRQQAAQVAVSAGEATHDLNVWLYGAKDQREHQS